MSSLKIPKNLNVLSQLKMVVYVFASFYAHISICSGLGVPGGEGEGEEEKDWWRRRVQYVSICVHALPVWREPALPQL